MSGFALVSIHPAHASNILSGKKVFEYRKVVPNKDVSHLALYCTAPVKNIIAVVEVTDCIIDSPTRVWSKTAYGSGIPRQYFRDYFAGRRSASAFVLGNVYDTLTPIDLRELTGQKSPPQSFYYLDDADAELLLQRSSATPTVPPSMVFVGGIHGVGKSTICKKTFGSLGYQCETASSLLAAHGRRTGKDKRVSNISDNQSLLIEQLILAKKQHCRLLLDGHFTLINKQGKIESISVDVFCEINPSRLILIKGVAVEICRRLSERDGTKWDVSFIELFQNIEEEHARLISESINIPLHIISNSAKPIEIARLFTKMKRGVPDFPPSATD